MKKLHLLSVLSLSLLLVTQSAYADFRKALEAYQNRDGATMLAEVKDAVDKKNNDGLILFMHALSIDGATSVRRNLYEFDKDVKAITLNNILSKPQEKELLSQLVIATNNSTDAQYFLLRHSRYMRRLAYIQYKSGGILPSEIMNLGEEWDDPSYTTDNFFATFGKVDTDFADRGNIDAIYNKYISTQYAKDKNINEQWLLKLAEAGSPYAQLRVGLKYLNYYGDYGCENDTKETICLSKDEAKGIFWLKKAAKNYEASGREDNLIFIETMCRLHQPYKGKSVDIHQGELWCAMVKNLYMPSSSQNLPDWILDARKELIKQDIPVFTYYVNDYLMFEIFVFADGRVEFTFNHQYPVGYFETSKDLLMKVSPKVVKKFLAELKKSGIYEWSARNPLPGGYCDNFCPPPQDYAISVRDGAKFQRVSFTAYSVQLLKPPADIKAQKVAKINSLVEKYFPTQRLRCELGNSTGFKQACLERDNQWQLIAKAAK